ncbi:MAG: YdcF family protein [Burkholderiaceae bacterium]
MNTNVLLVNLVSALLLPPLNLVILCSAGLLLSRKRRRFGIMLSGSALLALIVLSTKAGALLLVTPLENRTSPLVSTHNTGAQAIVVLGGGRLANAPEYGGKDIPSLTTLARLRYAAKLHRETTLPIMVTGGAPDGLRESEGAIMARTLREDFLVPVQWIEGDSNNTAENAALTAKILKREGVLRVLLVTDGLHMPRSTAAFEKSGLKIIPAPTILFSRSPLTFFDFLPRGEGLRRSHYAMHEWIGMAWYSLK